MTTQIFKRYFDDVGAASIANGNIWLENMDKKKLGTLEVSALSLGCMEMTGFYGNADRDQCIQAILVAFEQGISFFDTADSYGFGDNEALVGLIVTHKLYYRLRTDISTNNLRADPVYFG